MEPFEIIRVPYYLLSAEWRERNVDCGRISFMISSNNGLEDHTQHYRNERDRLLEENDGEYSRWVFTASKHKNLGGAVGHVTVFHFRVRDAY